MQVHMLSRRPRAGVRARALIGLGSAAALAVSGLAATATSAQAAPPLVPPHVFAPYFEAWTGQSAYTISQQSGAKYLTMAFLQTPSAGSCTAYWNGSTSQPVSSSIFGSDISSIQAAGGTIIPSFGGYTADTTGTDIADSCTSVSSIAQAYESLVTTYNVTRIDLDVEQNSLTNSAGITRRNQAIAQVESWAASTGRTVQFSYTMPTNTNGLSSSGVAVLQNAIANNAVISVVNIMTFDYYLGTQQEMATDTETAAQGLYNQLASLYPSKTSSQLWAMIGVTDMMGIDDYGAAETFTTADAPTVESWAASNGLGELSYWAVQRDNGGCPGTGGSSSCSGVSQATWYFDQQFEPFTSGAPAPGEAPFGGTPAAVPGTVQAANYDTGGQGVAYNVSSVNGSADSYRSDGVDLEATTDSQDT
ncbi:MAG TPA: glycosyl hydrolase family 18 protein, partial [Acidimicrobiales bacterium]|nr:glycosyl hydrolase family 18 protein [Acidimicrobiales bacterium]